MIDHEEESNLKRIVKANSQVKRSYEAAINNVFIGFIAHNTIMQARINEAVIMLHKSLNSIVHNSTLESWLAADLKNDNIFQKLFKPEALKNDTVKSLVYSRNEQALKEFINRRINGLNLSDRIWKQAEQFKEALEQKVQDGIGIGKSAFDIAKEVKEYLNNPLPTDKSLGKGIYKSPLKNSLRMTRTEINMSYRKADIERFKNTPFVLGYKVNLGNRHPTRDVCDTLADNYPASFVFVGWHPNCLCYVTSILADREQMDKYTQALLDGTDKDFKFKGTVTQNPDSLKNWLEENREKYEGHAKPPYFITDNNLYKQ